MFDASQRPRVRKSSGQQILRLQCWTVIRRYVHRQLSDCMHYLRCTKRSAIQDRVYGVPRAKPQSGNACINSSATVPIILDALRDQQSRVGDAETRVPCNNPEMCASAAQAIPSSIHHPHDLKSFIARRGGCKRSSTAQLPGDDRRCSSAPEIPSDGMQRTIWVKCSGNLHWWSGLEFSLLVGRYRWTRWRQCKSARWPGTLTVPVRLSWTERSATSCW